MITVNYSLLTVDELERATIAAIRIVEARGAAVGPWRYEMISSHLDREVRGKYSIRPVLSGRTRPLVEQGKDVDHVRVEAFGLDIQVRFRESP